MGKEAYSTIAGLLRVNHDRIVDTVLYKDANAFLRNEKTKKQFLKKHKLKEFSPLCPKKKELFSAFVEQNISLTKKQIRDRISVDLFIGYAINNINDIERNVHVLAKRLREWCGVYIPEIVQKIDDNEKLVYLLSKDRNTLLQEFRIKDSMGINLDKKDLQPILALAKRMKDLYTLKEEHKRYLESVLRKYTPNTVALIGAELTAELIELAGSLERLTKFPSSTIQMLGAEKALFKHLTKKGRCPRHGVIVKHPFLANAKQRDHGKVARGLANAVLLCIKLDYFKGITTKGAQLHRELQKKFK
jgi:nucleolar protein 56